MMSDRSIRVPERQTAVARHSRYRVSRSTEGCAATLDQWFEALIGADTLDEVFDPRRRH